MRPRTLPAQGARVPAMPQLHGMITPFPPLEKHGLMEHMPREGIARYIHHKLTGPLRKVERVLNEEALKMGPRSWPEASLEEIHERTTSHQAMLQQGFPSFLLQFPLAHRCMVWNERKVKRTRHLCASLKGNRPRGSKYLEVCVGKVDKKQVWISAHVLVAWAFHGPMKPGCSLIQHSCHNSRCLNGLHLEQGNATTNHHKNSRRTV